MNTHLLIPIINVEVKIQQLQLALLNGCITDEERYQLPFLKSLLATQKQISLDEKDIEERAINFFKKNEPAIYAKYAKLFNTQLDRRREYNDDKAHILNAYKQALKDLL